MLNILGNRHRNCDGIPRRQFLVAGASGMIGLSLTDLLRAEAAAGVGSSQKAVINIHLDGGPPQMDMIDLKPQAPREVRGEFEPRSSALPGVPLCELMPRMASIADRLAFIRSLVGSAGAHNAFQCQSGFDKKNLESLGGRPAMGCVVNRLKATPTDPTPAFVDLMQGRPLVRHSARPGFLGPAYKPFRPDMSQMFQRELETGMKRELAAQGAGHTTELKFTAGLDASRLDERATLLAALDKINRRRDASGMMSAMDSFAQQAAGILTSGKLADALDLNKVDRQSLQHYALDVPPGGERFVTADDFGATRKLLLARRLVEAGVRCVSVSFSDFDTHSKNFPRLRNLLPIVDHAIWALVTDLEQRGMLDDVSIVAWGEFGRTPRIDTKTGGRHHWPRVAMGILAGGGMNVGQVIGRTDREAGVPTARPVHYQDVVATLYHNLGIDARRTTVVDPSGRPQYLVEHGRPIAELI